MAEPKKNNQKNTQKNNASTNKKKAQSTKTKSNKQQPKQSEHDNKSKGVVMMLVGLILTLWFGLVFAGSIATANGVGETSLRVIAGLCNIIIALFLVYGGLLKFSQKKGKLSGWQILGWLFFLFAVLGIIYVLTFKGNIKASFLPSLKGVGGGLCGLLPGCLVAAIPSINGQYIVLSAFGILGIILGTDLKIFSYIGSLLTKDPEKAAERKEKKAAKAEAKRLRAEQKLLEQQAAAKLAEEERLNASSQNLVADFPTTPDYASLAQDAVGKKAILSKDKNYFTPPIITDYSGKMFVEMADPSKVTVGDLIGDAEQFNDPQFIKNLMPRISNKPKANGVTESELEKFADEVVANNNHDTEFDNSDTPITPLPDNLIIKDFSIKDLPSNSDLQFEETTDFINQEESVEEESTEDSYGLAVEDEATNEEISNYEAAIPQEDCSPEPNSKENSQEQNQASVATAKQVVAKKAESPSAGTHTYVLPPVSLLKGGINIKNPRLNKQIMDNSIALEEALASFGVKTKVVEVVCGPSVIRYELQPGPGVKVSKIVNLADDIALALAARGLRIEAPVPGKSVVGIEIAKSEVNPVFFKDVLTTEAFAKSKSKISIAFGIDINGNPIIGDLAEMPHLLIAGATGSGKSVCMNTLICSILFKATPDEVKIIMIDPKKVELASYNGLPHLGKPVVTDSKKAAGTLREIVNEMERRYTVFASAGVKNFTGFNQLKDVEPMPQIVVLIDELADLMMVASKDVEDAICRLAQMARAAGIHLVIATQRPSVDVITGLIKANVPSRIAFAVSSQIDSRTILDMGGAEKLLGKGDMLYFPIGKQKPIRVQGAFLSEPEIQALVEYCSNQAQQNFIDLPSDGVNTESQDGNDVQEDDELFLDACKQVISSGQASASSLQRRFRIGYNRAARLIETMEERGIVSPPEGNKRTVLIGQEMFKDMFEKNT